MRIRKIDERFFTASQIRPDQVGEIAALGFRTIICTRPDDEEAGQPSFDAVAAEAERNGLKAAHIPVSGRASEDQIASFRQVMAGCDGPVLGYCRSGTRAGNLYATLK